MKDFSGKVLFLDRADINTDEIIAAKYLTEITREALGPHLFEDLELDGFRGQGDIADKSVIIARANFGCGSSREHAPWALLDYGLQAVISTEIADIFRSNSLKNGFIPVIVDADTHAWLLDNPGTEVTIDVETATLTLPDERVVGFPIDGFARYCLLNGIDQLGFLQKHRDEIRQFEETRSWKP